MTFKKGNTDRRKDITGKKFGYLTAIEPVYKYFCGSTQEWVWSAQCICGKIINKRIGQLATGDAKSCGCMRNKAIAQSRIGSKNPMWVGDDVGYTGLHAWVKRYLKKPKLCQDCNKSPAYDLANKGIYDRNLSNWEWLCRRCHMTKDGRLEKFKKSRSLQLQRKEQDYVKYGRRVRS